MSVYGRIYEGTHAAMLLITDAPVGTEFIVTSGTNVGNKYEYRGATAGWPLISSANGAVPVSTASLQALSGGQSSSVAISATSAASAAITAGHAVVTPTVDCFFRAGAATPTALSDGTDQILLGGNTYRISGITSGHMLAFKTTAATGTVYISPGA